MVNVFIKTHQMVQLSYVSRSGISRPIFELVPLETIKIAISTFFNVKKKASSSSELAHVRNLKL